MPETEIIVIRHGETVWNLEGRWQGHFNSPLTKTGIKQAEAVAERFAEVKFATLYSSDLERAIQTAERIAKGTHHQLIPDSRLRERNLGIFEGLTVAEIDEQFPEHSMKYKSFDPDHIIPEGESMRQFSQRIRGCFKDLAKKHKGETILAVAHGGVLNQLFKFVINVPLDAPRNYTLLNASVNIFICADAVWWLKTWGDVSHIV
jgi:probable phosphoglycerate mutase